MDGCLNLFDKVVYTSSHWDAILKNTGYDSATFLTLKSSSQMATNTGFGGGKGRFGEKQISFIFLPRLLFLELDVRVLKRQKSHPLTGLGVS